MFFLLQLLICPLVIIIGTLFYFKPHLVIPTLRYILLLFVPGVRKRRLVLGNGLVCTYMEIGRMESSAESTLYLHGFTQCASDYLLYVWFLFRWRHVIFLNLLNHDDTVYLARNVETDDMMDYLELFSQKIGFHTRKIHLAGYSLGGFLSMHYASRYPERVASLLLINPYGLYDYTHCEYDAEKTFKNWNDLYFENLEDWRAFIDYTGNGSIPIFPNWLMNVVRHHRNSRSKIEGYVARGILKKNAVEMDKSILEKLSTTKVMYVQGENDRITPKEGFEYFCRHVPHVSFHLIKGGSHLVPITHIKTIASLLTNWVDSCVGKI